MVFSLSKERELVKSQERRSKARGRGRGNPAKPPQVGGARDRVTLSRYPAPKPGSGGITVIEPLDKSEDDVTSGVDTNQFEDVSAATVPADLSGEQPGLPLRRCEDSAEGAELGAELEEEEEVVMTVPGQRGPPQPQQGGGEGGVASHQDAVVQLPTSKPKRYSSQRQKPAGEMSGVEGLGAVQESRLLFGYLNYNFVLRAAAPVLSSGLVVAAILGL